MERISAFLEDRRSSIPREIPEVVVEFDESQKVMDGSVLMGGWLKKKNQMRWFELKMDPHPSLKWFKGPKQPKMQNQIEDLSQYEVIIFGLSDVATSFKLIPPQKTKETYKLTASTNSEMRAWVNQIQKVQKSYIKNFANRNHQYHSLLFKCFTRLPNEVLKRILDILSEKDLLSLSLLNKQFNRIMKELISNQNRQHPMVSIRETFGSIRIKLPKSLSFNSKSNSRGRDSFSVHSEIPNEPSELKYKWEKVLAKGREYFNKHPHKLQKMLREDMVDELRPAIWIAFTESNYLKYQHPNLYKELKNRKIPEEIELQIKCDLQRTFPQNPFFQKESTIESLNSVLHAFSLYNKNVEYTQGCNFLVGILLTILNEEDTFWVLVQLMNTYKFQGIFAEGFPILQKSFWIFDKLFKLYIPSLHAHFEEQKLVPSMYVTPWFMTVFSVVLNYNVVTRIWDVFLLRGWVFVFRVSIALLHLLKENLLQRSFEEILDYLRDVGLHITSEKEILDATFAIDLSNDMYQKLKRQYELEYNLFRK